MEIAVQGMLPKSRRDAELYVACAILPAAPARGEMAMIFMPPHIADAVAVAGCAAAACVAAAAAPGRQDM